MKNFRSDNESGVAPEIMAALAEANHGTAYSYGDDPWTSRLRQRLCELFETDLDVYPMTTGGAANALALAQMAPPYGSIYCHEHAHVHTDECGAPEFFSAGAKLMVLPGADARIDAATLAQALAATGEVGVHECVPSAMTLTQATEFGTVYTLDEIEALTAVAARHGLGVHMDGARFANAMASLNCSPADMTWRRGVHMLSFGATKNGALAAEALIVFDRARADGLDRRRKRAGHLLSKMRFISAQLLAYLEDDLWLRMAGQANRVASTLDAGFRSLPGVTVQYPVQSNEVFVKLPGKLVEGLHVAGYEFHHWPGTDGVYRLVASFQSQVKDAQGLIDTAHALAASGHKAQPA